MHPEVGSLSSIGAWGTQPGNCARDLQRLFLKEVKLAQPVGVKVKWLDSKRQQAQGEIDAAMLLPHLLFSSLFKYDEALVEHVLGLSQIKSFWDQVPTDDPRLFENPVLALPHYKETVLPIWIHGDGVAYGERDSLMVFSWGSFLTNIGALDSSFYIASWPKHCTQKPSAASLGTWSNMMKVMCWSFQALLQGVHPLVNWDGTDWVDGSLESQLAGTALAPNNLKVVVWGLLGDQEYFANTLGLPHWSKAQFCWHCNACRGDAQRSPWDIGTEAGWAYNTPQMEKENPSSMHAFFQELPGVSCFHVCLDVLHVLDLGVVKHLLGSALKHLVYHQLRHARLPPAQALASIWERLVELYEEFQVPTRLSNLYLSMFCNPKAPHASYPELEAKAVEMRHFLPVVTVLMGEYNRGTDDQQHRFHACQQLALAYQVLDREPMFMSQGASSECIKLYKGFWASYSWLNEWCSGQGWLGYNIVSKHHMGLHLMQQGKYMNPRLAWTYKAESWVGSLSALAHSTSFGTKGYRLSWKVAEKYRMMLHLRLVRPQFYD